MQVKGGAIMGEASGYGSAGSQDYVALLQQAHDDTSIEAIVLRINSPGGSAVASDEVAAMVLLANTVHAIILSKRNRCGAFLEGRYDTL